MKKKLALDIILIFLGLAFPVGGIFGVVYLSNGFYIFMLGAFFLVMGIIDLMVLIRKRVRMSGADLAKEIIVEQRRYLSRRIVKKQIKEIKLQKNMDKLKEEREYLLKALDKLSEDLQNVHI